MRYNIGAMQDFYFENKGYRIFCTAWAEVDNAVGVILLVHDLGDYCRRYDDFATFCNANGYCVLSMDLRAHGRTCGGYDHRGEVEGDCFADSVHDLYKLCCYTLREYRLPVVMMGVGYGALLTQGFLELYGEKLSAAVLMGSTQADTLLSVGGYTLASMGIGFVDGKNAGQFLSKLVFPAYEKAFKDEKTRYAWLTRDKEALKTYVSDPYCGAQFSLSLAFEQSLFKWLTRINNRRRLLRIPQDMPIWVVSGDADPVGGYGRDVMRLYNTLRQTGHANIALQLYPNARHALLWELNRDDVYMDALRFFNASLLQQ